MKGRALGIVVSMDLKESEWTNISLSGSEEDSKARRQNKAEFSLLPKKKLFDASF